MVGFSSASPFPRKKLKVVTQGKTTGIDHPMWRGIQGVGIVKDWEDKRDHGSIPETFT